MMLDESQIRVAIVVGVLLLILAFALGFWVRRSRWLARLQGAIAVRLESESKYATGDSELMALLLHPTHFCDTRDEFEALLEYARRNPPDLSSPDSERELRREDRFHDRNDRSSRE